MFQIGFRTILCLILVSQLSTVMAASPAIGVAMAQGSFRVDEARVMGNSTLFEGATVETSEAASQLRLNDGVFMRLASSSRGTIFRDRLVLEQGIGQLEHGRDFRIEAKGLQIVSGIPGSAARVELKEDDVVQVDALRGNFRVTDANGIVLAALPAGRALAFDVKNAGASAPEAITGCLVKRDGSYFLADETSGVTVEVQGENLDSKVGWRVTVNGVIVPSAQPQAEADHVVRVISLNETDKRCSSPAAAAAASPGKQAGAAAGMSGTTKAVIAGVVVSAAAAGTAIGVTAGGDDTPPTISQ